jgi:hypothetical protein
MRDGFPLSLSVMVSTTSPLHGPFYGLMSVTPHDRRETCCPRDVPIETALGNPAATSRPWPRIQACIGELTNVSHVGEETG